MIDVDGVGQFEEVGFDGVLDFGGGEFGGFWCVEEVFDGCVGVQEFFLVWGVGEICVEDECFGFQDEVVVVDGGFVVDEYFDVDVGECVVFCEIKMFQ